MKKYFAKYLPVEGEIKEGDKFWMKNVKRENSLFKRIKPHPEYAVLEEDGEHLTAKKINSELAMTVYLKQCTKIELFLCSKEGFLYDNEDKYKVIGEISKEAIWVKEGDKFDKEELAFHPKNYTFHQEFKDIKDFNAGIDMCNKGFWEVSIKCPKCQKFH